MSVLNKKKIILGVCGGIAAYKAAELVRLLCKQGAQVQVVMTAAAEEFMTALTFQALSGRAVRTSLFDKEAEAGMGHIELARWADLILIAPTTANTMAKLAHGIADDLLTTLCSASKAPLLIAPAMNQQMWCSAATQENLAMLNRHQQFSLCGPADGEQACGDIGPGRMEEAQTIVQCAIELLDSAQPLQGKRVLITAGPTIEDIDPVRYLTNRSSGKMGYAIAQAALRAGAEVILVSGPVALQAPDGLELHQVRSAQQMYDSVFKALEGVDVFIATAAVADYRPVIKNTEKIKKNADTLTIELLKNPDILSDVAALIDKPLCVGFAAETNDVEAYALDKLQRKNLDMIAANQVGETQGFETDDNELCLYWYQAGQKQTKVTSKKLPYASKKQLAGQLINEIVLLLNKY